MLHSRPPDLLQQAGHVRTATQQEHAAHATERGAQRFRPIEIAHGNLHAGGHRPFLPADQGAHRPTRTEQLPHQLPSHVSGGAGDEDHGSSSCSESAIVGVRPKARIWKRTASATVSIIPACASPPASTPVNPRSLARSMTTALAAASSEQTKTEAATRRAPDARRVPSGRPGLAPSFPYRG